MTRNDKRQEFFLTELLRAPPKLQGPALRLKGTIWLRRSGVSGGRASTTSTAFQSPYQRHTPG